MYLKHYLSYFLAFRTNNYKTKPVTPTVFGRQLLALENENAQWFLKNSTQWIFCKSGKWDIFIH